MKNKLKPQILFLLHLPPPVHGSSIVGKMILDNKKLNETFNCTYINLLASSNVKESGKFTFRKTCYFVYTWFSIFFELIKVKPKFCYVAITATGAAFYKDVLIIFLLKLFNVKCIYHMHNKGVKHFQAGKINFKLYQYVFKEAEVILLSKRLYNDISSFVKLKNTYVCPNGIPNNIVPFSKKYNEVPQILFLSNLIETKGIIVLLDACKKLLDKGIRYQCIFIGGEGDITKEKFSELLVEKGLEGKVQYLGKMYGEEKYNAFRKSDIFAFPTFYSNETFGLVNLEAMQHYLPIISTDEGGIPDLVKDGINGFIIPKNEPVVLAQKLELLIKNKDLRKRMGDEGRQLFEKQFTSQIFEDNIVSILKTFSEG